MKPALSPWAPQPPTMQASGAQRQRSTFSRRVDLPDPILACHQRQRRHSKKQAMLHHADNAANLRGDYFRIIDPPARAVQNIVTLIGYKWLARTLPNSRFCSWIGRDFSPGIRAFQNQRGL